MIDHILCVCVLPARKPTHLKPNLYELHQKSVCSARRKTHPYRNIIYLVSIKDPISRPHSPPAFPQTTVGHPACGTLLSATPRWCCRGILRHRSSCPAEECGLPECWSRPGVLASALPAEKFRTKKSVQITSIQKSDHSSIIMNTVSLPVTIQARRIAGFCTRYPKSQETNNTD